ncbi:MAG: hypothetical protein QXM75_01420 [Candidatus Diapherotrites archaeon]
MVSKKEKSFENYLERLENTVSVINAQKERELNSEIACKLLSIYFRDIATHSLKREVALSDLVKAYKFVMKLLEEKEEKYESKNTEETIGKTNEHLMQIKKAIEEPVEKPYSYINKKGEIYYLQRKGNFYFFSKTSEGAVPLPKGYSVYENKRTGMPIIKKTS